MENGKRRFIHEVPRGTETILLVHNDPLLRAQTARFLTSCGYKVMISRSGEDAAAMVTAFDGEVALVISDLMLPGMDGVTLFESVRSTGNAVKFILTSGYAMQHVPRLAEISNQVSFLREPWRLSALAIAVRDALDGP